jgi:ABC-type sulfate transport system permease component
MRRRPTASWASPSANDAGSLTALDWLTPDEWQAVRLSLVVAGRSVVFGLPLAVLAALAIVRGRFPGRALLDAVVHLPYGA